MRYVCKKILTQAWMVETCSIYFRGGFHIEYMTKASNNRKGRAPCIRMNTFEFSFHVKFLSNGIWSNLILSTLSIFRRRKKVLKCQPFKKVLFVISLIGDVCPFARLNNGKGFSIVRVIVFCLNRMWNAKMEAYTKSQFVRPSACV